MSLYSYEAVDHHGRRIRRELEADSERDARKHVRSQQLVLRSLKQLEHQNGAGEQNYSQRLSGNETSLLLYQLSILIGSGMTLVDALASVADSMESRRSRRVAATLKQRITEGESLASAMSATSFDDLVCNMIAAGEETGQLETVLGRLSEVLDHRQKMRQEFLSAILYPSVIMVVGLIVLAFMMVVVVPKMVSLFDRAGGELPLLTQWVISLSEFVRDYGWFLLLGTAAVYIGQRLAMRLPSIKMKFDRMILLLPVVGTLVAKIETARFTRTLGMLMTGGVEALQAMHIASQGFTRIPLRQAAEGAATALREGESISKGLSADKVFPDIAIRLIAVGEQSGKLELMLLRVADLFENETSRLLKRLVTILEPALVLIMALLVGLLAVAILLPIIEMNQMVR